MNFYIRMKSVQNDIIRIRIYNDIIHNDHKIVIIFIFASSRV